MSEEKNYNGTYRSMFIVWNNPEYDYVYKHNERGEIVTDNGEKVILDKIPTVLCGKSYDEMCEYVVDTWCKQGEGYSAACVYCISAEGLHHLHIVFETSSVDGKDKKFRYSAVKKIFNQNFHVELTKGTKQDVEDYIYKQGRFAEKGEQIMASYRHGDIKGNQGARNDLKALRKMIFEDNMTPDQILEDPEMVSFFDSRKYETIKRMYVQKKKSEMPVKRDVAVHWCFGKTGSGKSHQYTVDFEKYGKYHVWRTTNYKNGFLDNYMLQSTAFFDEYRGQLMYSELLDCIEGYNSDLHCRGTGNDKPVCWNKLYICSPFCPDGVYHKMVSDADAGIDSIEQLMRRLTTITYFETDHPKYGPWRKYTFKGDGWDFFQKYKIGTAGLKNVSMNDYFLALIADKSPLIETVHYPGKPRPTV